MQDKVDANPTRSFFVHQITKDISLIDCILDLIDNSIDGAKRETGHPEYSLSQPVALNDFFVEIFVSEEEFSITDNCGGISFNDAVNYAFTFGRKANHEIKEGDIGVYGIGMKRAIFKVGKDILIQSTGQEDVPDDSFLVPIEVDQWLNDESKDWDFDIEEADRLDSPGVRIAITDLNEQAALEFGNAAFIRELRSTISRDYAFILASGFSISVNGKEIDGWTIELKQGDELKPIRRKYIDDQGDSPVRIEIVAGMASAPPNDNDPEDADARATARDGWYVVCNSRIVLAADKTKQSVWGTPGMPIWHPQYHGFIGLIFFDGLPSQLPLRTTKRDIDPSSRLYMRAQEKMRSITKNWISYTNDRRLDIQRAQEMEGQAKAIALSVVETRNEATFPQLEAKPKRQRVNILYKQYKDRVDRLKEALGNRNMSNKQLGEKSFEYMYDDYVEE